MHSQTSSFNAPFSLFIADVHLQPEINHPINQNFEHFLDEWAPQAQTLYILGDLFEMWVGDDIGLVQYQRIIHKLQNLTTNGLAIYLLFGNRDFLMRQAFWQATGIQPLAEPSKINLYGNDYLLLHGDSLCTEDKAYQRMRRILRHPVFTWFFLQLSPKKRLEIGNKMRQKSYQYSELKPAEIMDVSQQAVCDLFKAYPTVQHMIHGHTHRPGHHITEAQHATLHRWVLGDWRPESQVLKVSKLGPELLPFSN